MTPPLWALTEELEALSRRFPAGLDPYGTLYAILEGGPGGPTLLVWTPWKLGPQALQAILAKPFAGRVILGLDASGGDATPLFALAERFKPRATLIVEETAPRTHRFSGGKWVETEGGSELVPLDDPRPALRLRRRAPTGLVYEETRRFLPWVSPALAPTGEEEGPPIGAAALAAGSAPYGTGLPDLTEMLQAIRTRFSD